MEKKVLVDLSYINPKAPTGVSTYAIRLLSGIKDIIKKGKYPIKCILIVNRDNKAFISQKLSCYELLVYKDCWLCLRNYHYKKWLEEVVSRFEIDLFFIPFFTIWSVVPSKTKTIAVIHDVQPLVLNNKLKNILYLHILGKKIESLSQIVTISNFSKSQIEFFFKKSNEHISVIYNSLGINIKTQQHQSVINTKYILNVNAVVGYKNQITLIKAFNRIKDKIPHSLLLKGKKTKYWQKVLKPYIEEHGLNKRVILIDKNLNEDEMASLYIHADLFVNPSQMEGFGFTPIEAALFETPVLTTKCTALYETTMGVLEYYDPPTDDIVLAKRILECLNKKPSKQHLLAISKKFEEIYSQEKQANNYIELIEKMLS